MPIHVKYFASLRERMGRAEEIIDSERAATVGEVWAYVTEGQTVPANVLVAVNMEYADFNRSVRDGDEVAFFPPVTGG
jgi:sulfur-carrier protein